MTLDPDPYAASVIDEILAGAHGPNVEPTEIRREVNAAFTLTAPSVRAATAHVVLALVRLGAPPMQVARAVTTFGLAFAALDPSVLSSTARVASVTMRATSLVSDIEEAIGRIAAALLDRSPLGQRTN